MTGLDIIVLVALGAAFISHALLWRKVQELKSCDVLQNARLTDLESGKPGEVETAAQHFARRGRQDR